MNEGRLLIVEEAQCIVASGVPWVIVRRASEGARERENEPPAFSEKNVSSPPITFHHPPSPSITHFQGSSDARSVFMVTDPPSAMGQRIRLLRAELDMSQRELAVKAGVGRATIERAERGRRKPQSQTAHKIAVALGITLAQLEGEEGAEHGNDRSEGDGR
jgi:DNA-binding XRE family transcriptional regulator